MASDKTSLPLRISPCSYQDGKARVSVEALFELSPVLTLGL